MNINKGHVTATFKLLFVVCCFVVSSFSLAGCQKAAVMNVIPDHFVALPGYFAEGGDYVGEIGDEEDLLSNVFTLDGLDREDFLLYSEASVVGNSPSKKVVYMNGQLQDPMFQYDVSKIIIEHETADGEYITKTITDSEDINTLVTARKNASVTTDKNETTYVTQATFCFDLPCELAWSCTLRSTEDGLLLMRCVDPVSGDYVRYLTNISSSVFDEYL